MVCRVPRTAPFWALEPVLQHRIQIPRAGSGVGGHDRAVDSHDRPTSSDPHESDAVDATLARQVRALEVAVRDNPAARAILERAPQLELPGWYLGAGGVTQTVWNLQHGFDPTRGIKDYDLVYFDPTDLGSEAEQAVQAAAGELFADLGVKLDVTNEARVHLWYPDRFARSIPPYRSTEHAISTWPTTASSIGVRYQRDVFVVCAPFGLRDLFAMVLRPNKAIIDEAIYDAKAARWAENWPMLSVTRW